MYVNRRIRWLFRECILLIIADEYMSACESELFTAIFRVRTRV